MATVCDIELSPSGPSRWNKATDGVINGLRVRSVYGMKCKTGNRVGIWLLILGVSTAAGAKEESALSFGNGSCGRLQGGVALPCRGTNFEVFSRTACVLGRNHLHPLVRDTVVDAFQELAETPFQRVWQYGETGKAAGGRLWPHKTHQNGLAADFFMPVINERGEPARVPISVWNKFGYSLEFGKTGTLDTLRIDWSALGAHLLALEAAGRKHRVTIERIIITPDFHDALFANVPAVRRMAPLFMKREAWVRHDEHYHVDFSIPSSLRRPLSCH